MIESHLLRPWWLLALPALAAMLWYARPAGSLDGWLKAIDPPLLAALKARGHVLEGSRWLNIVPGLAAALIALALAGPAAMTGTLGAYRNLDGVVILLDASRSMTLGGNLPAARLAAGAVADAAGARQTALVLYAGDAYAVTPFVSDTRLIHRLLAGVASETVPDFGSRPARALGLAKRMFESETMLQGDVVVISDGGRVTAAALDQAKALGNAGFAVHAVFVPATETLPALAPISEAGGIDRLAQAGGGVAAHLGELEPLIARLKQPIAKRLAASPFGALAWTDLGPWLLLLASLPALALFGRAR